MTSKHCTLKNLVSQMGHALGAHAAWLASPSRRISSYRDGADFTAKRQALHVVKEIIRAHPEFKREAATWIKRGISMTKCPSSTTQPI